MATSGARAAFESWSSLPVETRASYLDKISAGLKAHMDEMATAIAREVGMPLKLARAVQVGGPVWNWANFAKADADLEAAVKGAISACLLNSGQTCSAHTRMLVPESRYEEVKTLAQAAIAKFNIGPSLEESSKLGPLVSAAQRDRVLGFIEHGVKEGAEVKPERQQWHGAFAQARSTSTADRSMATHRLVATSSPATVGKTALLVLQSSWSSSRCSSRHPERGRLL